MNNTGHGESLWHRIIIKYVRAEHHHWHPQGLAIGRGIVRLCLLEVPQESWYIEFGVNVKGTWITAMEFEETMDEATKEGDFIVIGQVILISQIKFFYRSRIRVLLLYNTYVLNMWTSLSLLYKICSFYATLSNKVHTSVISLSIFIIIKINLTNLLLNLFTECN